MALIEYKKAYDMVPQSWIIHCLKGYKISHEVTKHGQGKTTNLLYTAILEATLQKEDIGKEWLRSGKNVLAFRRIRLADQIRTIIKKFWFSDLDIQEIHQKIKIEQNSNTVGPVLANFSGDLGSIPGRVIPKTLKMVLDTSLLNTRQYKVRIKGKVELSKGRSSALPYTFVY